MEQKNDRNSNRPQDNQTRRSFSLKNKQDDWHDHADTTKYLDLEQPGVSFTPEGHPTMNSDFLETGNYEHEKFRMNGGNSRNADAFSQDDYILRDNIDLDEDQNESISNEDNDK